MRLSAVAIGVAASTFSIGTLAVSRTPQAPASGSEVYHVHFAKAAAGQAAALGKALMEPDPASKMPTHFIVLRHQEGDDWDYAVVQHMGTSAAVTAAAPAPNPARDLYAWHNDTFVAGPPWADFTRQMGIGGAGTATAVYVVGVHRAVPGHRDQLLKLLSAPTPATAKVQPGAVLLAHLEGSDWTFMTVSRYNSWQDFATERAQATPSDPGGWADIRQHSAFHRDTIADRIYPAK
jgi:hypothetical protein